VACAVADIKILPLAYEPKAEERKEERKATPPPLRNCHMLAVRYEHQADPSAYIRTISAGLGISR